MYYENEPEEKMIVNFIYNNSFHPLHSGSFPSTFHPRQTHLRLLFYECTYDDSRIAEGMIRNSQNISLGFFVLSHLHPIPSS